MALPLDGISHTTPSQFELYFVSFFSVAVGANSDSRSVIYDGNKAWFYWRWRPLLDAPSVSPWGMHSAVSKCIALGPMRRELWSSYSVGSREVGKS